MRLSARISARIPVDCYLFSAFRLWFGVGLDTYSLWKTDTETPPGKNVSADFPVEGMYTSTDILA